ncbi:MAG: 16S rRNA (cytosine(1402)-N(4))-methyltransferase RsmH [Rhodospirillales bacterium]|nr:16S rRNA (cytosine(1402)-N(4))-methyltransferase RsmH [Rhodospirillales bacterium]
MSPASGHVPVMKEAMLSLIAPQDGGVYVDGTFGGGGYSEALLESASCVVYGIDRDADALRAGEALSLRFGGRLILVHGRFGEMATLLASRQVNAVDGIVLDLGLSSRQLDDGARGFSFRLDGPLDMRMDRDDPGPTAADLVNGESESGLAAIIADFGEERRARAIARAIVAARAEGPITSTGRLAEIVRPAVARRPRGGIDDATRTFQALRLRVNDEIGEIERGLRQIERLLRPSGRAIVVSFHSLEDRPVKRFFRERSEPRQPNRHEPPAAMKSPDPTFRLLTRRARKPDGAEVSANPRARSARLRAAERTGAPPWHERLVA